MQQFNTIFNQFLQLIPKQELNKLISKYNGDRYVKHFTTFNLLTTLMYGQLRGKDSLRDVVLGLNQHQKKWSHLGIKKIARSTIADANNRVDYQIFEKLFYTLLSRCDKLSSKKKFKFKNGLYALDATIIDLCLSVFDWAKFRKQKGGIKLHCLMDVKKGHIPSFIHITNAHVHEANIPQNIELPLTPDSIITFDKAYLDLGVFSAYTQNGIWFVTRAKKNMKYDIVGQHPLPHRKGLLFDQEIVLKGHYQSLDYPHKLRLVGYKDPENGTYYEFLTNNFKLSAATIAMIYKQRWQIELFFKWIKQHLEIKTFLGTSKNAVMSQIWIAMCTLLILQYIKFQTKYRLSLLNLSRIINEMLFDRVSLIDILGLKPPDIHKIKSDNIQLSFC